MITLNELSKRLDVSKNNLIKASNQLAKLGLIETTKGRSGGLTIRENAGQTSLREIIVRTEHTFYMAACFTGKRCDCTFLKHCLLKKKLAEALDAFLNSLEKTTLDDITP